MKWLILLMVIFYGCFESPTEPEVKTKTLTQTVVETVYVSDTVTDTVNQGSGVTFMDLRQSQLTNDDILFLENEIQLKKLYLSSNPHLTDLSPLSSLVNLECLQLCEITDLEDISPLSSCVNLEYLDLQHGKPYSCSTGVCRRFCPVWNLSPLSGLPLKHLVLKYTSVTHLSPIANIPTLEYLDIRYIEQQIVSYDPIFSALGLGDTLECNVGSVPDSIVSALFVSGVVVR